jgi:cytochrome P450
VTWTDAHGGFWAVSGYAEVVAAAKDDDAFRSGDGVTIPRAPFRVTPIEMDPPEFFALRRILNPPFSPGAVAGLEADVRRITTELIDAFITRGRAEVVNDLARPLPGRVTLRLVGFDENEWPAMHKAVHSMIGESGFGTADADEVKKAALAGRMWQRDRIRELIQEHRDHPGAHDITTMLLEAEMDGERLSEADLVDTIALLLDGGLDTTASSITFALQHLSDQPELKQQLLDDPSLMTLAIEELLRCDAPVQGLARTASRDCDFAGQHVSKGDRMLLLWAAANRDPASFDNADELDIRRENNRHVTFGIGNHKCIGAHLARLMIRVVLDEVLHRLPDFKVVPGTVERAADVGTVYSFDRMEIVFTPRAPAGGPRP